MDKCNRKNQKKKTKKKKASNVEKTVKNQINSIHRKDKGIMKRRKSQNMKIIIQL